MDEEAGHVGCFMADDLHEQVLRRELQDASADPDFTGRWKRPGKSPSHAAAGAEANPGFEIRRAPHRREAGDEGPRAGGQGPDWALDLAGGTAASDVHEFPCP
jgi:hypothetical protein